MDYRSYMAMLLILGGVGCASRKEFIRSRDYDIGKTTREAWVPDPISIEPINDLTSRYIYEYKETGCRFAYTVDNLTKRVLSWQFLSDPDRCYTTPTFID